MARRPQFALAFLSALAGCAGPQPKGPLVELRDGITPITRPAPREATYALIATDQPHGPVRIAEHQVGEGQRIGFRREEDRSVVAVTPTSALPISPGAYVWEMVPGSEVVHPMRERVREHIQADIRETTKATKTALLIGLIAAVVIGFNVAYGIGQSNTNSARR
jgi:hypothetical protein